MTRKHERSPFQSIPNRMREFREGRGWKLSDMNRASGVGITTLKNLEAGEGRPRIDTCHRIAAALGRSVGDVWPVPPELVGATFNEYGIRTDVMAE